MGQRCGEWSKIGTRERAIIEGFHRDFPVRLGELAKAMGLVVKVATLPANVSGEIRRTVGASPSGFTIRINKHERKERQRFTLAHEIAHFLLHLPLIKDGLSDDVLYRSTLSNAREAEANRLATEILMPIEAVESLLREIGEKPENVRVNALADRFGVSEAAAKIRLS